MNDNVKEKSKVDRPKANDLIIWVFMALMLMNIFIIVGLGILNYHLNIFNFYSYVLISNLISSVLIGITLYNLMKKDTNKVFRDDLALLRLLVSFLLAFITLSLITLNINGEKETLEVFNIVQIIMFVPLTSIVIFMTYFEKTIYK